VGPVLWIVIGGRLDDRCGGQGADYTRERGNDEERNGGWLIMSGGHNYLLEAMAEARALLLNDRLTYCERPASNYEEAKI
jgi:hypothetical protein